MNRIQRTGLACAATLLLAAGWSTTCAAAAANLAEASIEAPNGGAGPITREQVRAELAQWRAAGLLDRAGDAGATEQVLAAREAYNQQMASAIYARLQQEQELAAAEAARVAEAERVRQWVTLPALPTAADADPMAMTAPRDGLDSLDSLVNLRSSNRSTEQTRAEMPLDDTTPQADSDGPTDAGREPAADDSGPFDRSNPFEPMIRRED
jgi:hypothetical protein